MAGLVANWDVFHADRLELERGLDSQAIRAALTRGDLQDDDLVRPAGSSIPWARIADIPELISPPAPALPPQAEPPSPPQADAGARPGDRLPDFEEVQPSIEKIVPPPNRHEPTLLPESSSSDVAFPVIEADLAPPEPRESGPAVPPVRVWTWDEEDEDEEEEEEDDRDQYFILEDQADIEILADDGPPETTDDKQPQAPSSPPDHTRTIGPRPGESPAAAGQHDRWEPSELDLDWNDRTDSRSSHVALPIVRSRDRDEGKVDGESGENDEAGFSLSRSATEKIEELDLAPMVDVAFNLVLFFMVTATTVLYKTLEIPKPSGEAPASAVAQGRSRSLDDLKDDYILVEIDDSGAMKLDREPIAPVIETLVEQLRTAREKTGRKTMLLSADYATLHRNAVLAYDAANEIGLGIAIAKPQTPQGPAPMLRGASAAPPRPPTPGAGGPL